MRFADLFCGIGGFHAALSRLGHECVFACDADESAASVYRSNFGISAHKDIRDCSGLPIFDVLCAGFPCQPFSKSGSQEGFDDATRGTLFHEIIRIVNESKPKVLFLENVPNLESHDRGNTYKIIKQSIETAGYNFWSEILSPHTFGTPQIRKRLYMVAIRKDLCGEVDFEFPKGNAQQTDVRSILDSSEHVDSKYSLCEREIEILETWNFFIQTIKRPPPSPTWSQEFGRKYPLEDIHPISKKKGVTVRLLKQILEDEGKTSPSSRLRSDVIGEFPSYISKSKKPLPSWKKRFVMNNRQIWQSISDEVGDEWLTKVRTFDETYQKFEWQVGDGKRDIWEHLIQFRPSGIRVKKGNYIPALVAIAQIPIVGWEKRRMTPRECARAQDFDVDGAIGQPFILSDNDAIAYKQLGNAVNVKVTSQIMKKIESFLEGD